MEPSAALQGFPPKNSMVASGLRLARGYAIETAGNGKAIGLDCSTACIPVKRKGNGDRMDGRAFIESVA